MNEEPIMESPPEATGASAEGEERRMNEISRVANMFFSPGETFEDINRKPTWLIPLLMALVFSLAVGALFRAKVLTPEAFEQMTRQRMEEIMEKRGAQMSEEMMEQALKSSRITYRLWHVFTVGSTLLMLIVIAGVYFLVLLLLQAEAPFKKVFSVVTWSWMVYAVASGVIAAITLLLKSPETIDPTNLESIVATNLAAFLSRRETSPAVYSLASSLDIFSIWFLILLSIGFSKISKKVSVKKAAIAVFALWILYILGKAGFASFRGIA